MVKKLCALRWRAWDNPMRAVLVFAEFLEQQSRGLAPGPGSLKVHILSINCILNLNELYFFDLIKLFILVNQLG